NRPVSGIAVDTTTGPDDIVYVAWRLNLAGKPARPAIAVSTDGARTFGPPIDVAADFFANPANITGTIPEDRKKPEHLAGFNPAATIDDKGRLYVLWERRTTGVTPAPQFAYYVSRVTDQGRSITVHEVFPETPNLAGGVLTWSPEGGADGTLHAVWHAKPGQTQGETDIYHRRSIDGGRTWGQPTKLNDDDPAALQSQFNPNVSIAPDGRVDVAWWDFRNDQGTYSNDVYYTYSTDNGLSWSRNVRISDRSINRKIGPWSNNFDMRQPPGVGSADEYAVFVWDDTRNGDSTVQAQDMYAAAVQFEPLARSGVPNAVKIVLAVLVGLGAVGLILLLTSAVGRRRSAAGGAGAERSQPVEVA
ncbi:MAG: hypothetical protein ACRD0F_07870, partial [Acidimicrobiales bacterium]